MKSKQIKLSKPFYQLAKAIVGQYIKNYFHITYTGTETFADLKPPYLILGNHTNFWDPVMVAHGVPEPIHFITSDEYFRKFFLKNLLRQVGAIPKTKFVSDSETVKNIFRVKREKGVIGIFPEGRRNWDGKTLNVLYPTAKLVKSLQIPVIIALLKGAALSFPRWADKPRRGELIVEYKLIFTEEEVGKLSVDEIYNVMQDSLNYNEYDWQREKMVPFKGKRLAEHLELFLFICPHCKEIESMKSYHNRFFCQKCGYSVAYSEYGFFVKESGNLYFDNPGDWNQWQLKQLQKHILDPKDSIPILSDKKVILFKGKRLSPLKKYRIGKMALYDNRLEFITLSGEKHTFIIDKISGMNIQYNDQFEFYHDKILYRFIFKVNHTSAYKWLEAIQMIKNINESGEKNE